MSLDALAPDQRAVVQLVLQQERTYEELAGLLGISTEAVRERAHNGLERLAPGSGVPEDQRAQVADYLLAQQSVSKREATRALLASSPDAREWAESVAGELRDVAAGPLPEIPAGEAARPSRREPEPEPVRETEPTKAPAVRARPRPRPAAAAEPETEPERSERPARPRREREKPSTTPPPRPPITEGARSSSSKLGGALLIGGIAIALVAVIVLLVGGGDDKDGGDTKTTGASSTPTATATSSFQPVGQIELSQVGGGKAKGQLVIFASADNQLAFTIQATGMPESKRGEAYAVWLVGGKKPHRLGFAPAVAADGKFGTSGPRNADAKDFPNWLSEAKQVVVSRETSQDTTQPGPIVLGGDIPSGQG